MFAKETKAEAVGPITRSLYTSGTLAVPDLWQTVAIKRHLIYTLRVATMSVTRPSRSPAFPTLLSSEWKK